MLAHAYERVRRRTEAIMAPLTAEDAQVQSMPDASPAKWHLAHTAWFFEELVLARAPTYRRHHDAYARLFNSYYEALGPRHARPQRGLLTRPTLDEVRAYRRAIDDAMLAVCESPDDETRATILVGLAHEEQHQELLLTDILHAFSCNPLRPAYAKEAPGARAPKRLGWIDVPGGVTAIGHAGDAFAFDNERPRHDVLIRPFAIASRLVTTGEYAAFIDDGGYARPELWLSDGWALATAEAWRAPIYWEKRDGGFAAFGLHGTRPIDPNAPVTHVSYYEADAFARWAGARLPTEAEWEIAATTAGAALEELFDEAWQWTASPYVAYPGFRPFAGALGEYNGKFMCNQMVLRGGSRFTPPGHSRATYRNFFPPHARWQRAGIRLARG